jgi:hypothetical protein
MISSEEIISGNNLAAKCDYVFAQMCATEQGVFPVFTKYAPSFKGGEVVFCKTDYIVSLRDVVNQFVPRDVPFTILTHDSDYAVTNEMTQLFADRPVKWYGMNCSTETASPIPIGVANSYSKGNLNDFERTVSPTRLLYVNNRVHNYPDLRQWLYNHFSSKSWATIRVPYEHAGIDPRYKEELLDHKFVLCPRGNGVDTHRMWEAMYSGVIPVVVRHRTHALLEGQLPILFVDDYSEVNEHMLNEAYEKFSKSIWNMDMLKVSWWMELIRRYDYAY